MAPYALQRQDGLNAVRQEFVYKVTVELEALLINLDAAFGKHTCPGDGERVAVHAEVAEKLDVLPDKVRMDWVR